MPFHSSFIFKTYELNDRILLERNLTNQHKCIIIGGGIGFIPAIVNDITKNKVLIFEINNKILKNLRENLKGNKIKFEILNYNLLLNKKNIQKYYYSNENFLATSMFRKSKKKVRLKNILFSKVKNIK